METLTLTAPISLTGYRVRRLVLDWAEANIDIVVRNNNNEELKFKYSGAVATTLMTQLNKLDLSAQSLHTRILNRLVSDGFLPAGNVTGAPD